MLSVVFEPFMQPYLNLERTNIDEQLASVVTGEAVDNRGGFPVLTSSIHLFVYLNNSIKRCTALTTGSTFFSLYEVMKASLSGYCKLLAKKLPSPMGSSGGLSLMTNSTAKEGTRLDSGNKEQIYKVPPGGEIAICHVIDTNEYCDKTIETLQEIIQEKIDKSFEDKVDLSEVQDEYNDLTALCLKVLISGLQQRLEGAGAWKELNAVRWGDFDMVGEESKYVQTITNEIQPFVTAIVKLIPSSYFRNFCDKFATSFINQLHNVILKQRRITETGAQQLLLDITALRTLTLKLPVLGNPGAITSSMFTKQVTVDFGKIEMLLKLISTPSELLVDVFKTNFPEADGKELVVVMGLKGMKSKEMNEKLEALGLSGGLVGESSGGGASTGNSSYSITADSMKSTLASLRRA